MQSMMVMLGHVLERILGPAGYRMHLAIFITHEIELIDSDCNGFGPDAEKSADIDHRLGARTHAMQV